MASYTTNYNLIKPANEDFIDIGDLNSNADAIDTAIKASTDTANAALPESNFTGINILAELAADNGVLPTANGGTGANNASTARDNLGAFRRVAAYENGGATDLDTTTLEFAVVALSASLNAGLFAIIPDQFAFVTQHFYNSQSSSTRRIQIAHGFYSDRMATRTSSGSTWGTWQPVYTGANAASLIQTLLAGGSISVVRQIIKGTVAMSGTSNVAVTVSLTNAAKAHVVINGNGTEPYLVSLTNTTLTLKNNVASSYTASYQIVEYY